MKIKKEGSSLIFVIIIFMFVCTVSIGMLSMISANYKARVVENKRIKNLYGADSGIDVAYNIIGKTFDAATKYGYYCVKELQSTETTSDNKVRIKGNSKSINDAKYKEIKEDINLLKIDIEKLEKSKTNLEKNNTNNENIDQIEIINSTIAKKYELIQEDSEIIDLLLNEEFKRGFINFIKTPDDKADNESPPNKLTDSLKLGEYIDDVKGIDSFTKVGVLYPNSENGVKPDLSQSTIEVPDTDKTTSEYEPKSGHPEDVSINIIDKYIYEINIKSTFQSKENNATGPNLRTIQANYKVTVPNYDDIFFGKGDREEYLALEDRALTIGGDMNVVDAKNLNVDGNVFVQGKEPKVDPTDKDRTYKKYSGGIKLIGESIDSNSVTFNKDVITRNTFNIQDNTNAIINGNLYARNVYMGKMLEGDNGLAKNSTLTLNSAGKGQVVLDNDLTLKAKGSTISMNDFYGINDKNIYYENDDQSISIKNGKSEQGEYTKDVEKSSSSIIVNGYKDRDDGNKSILEIKKSAYIMGTAHIATNDDYQTGESGAVKGNYSAYKSIDNSFLDQDNVFEKAKYFSEYWNEKGNADTGGIIWPPNQSDIHSVGAIVYDSTYVIPHNYTPDLELINGKVYEKRKEFAKKVYKLGQDEKIEDYDNTVETAFDSLMNLYNVPTDYNIENSMKSGNEFAIVNDDKKKDIVIKKSENGVEDINVDTNSIQITVSPKDTNVYRLNAVIVSAGNISIGEGIVLNGDIVANGDLNINGDNITINYVPEVVERIQAKNTPLFQAIFGVNVINNEDTSSNKSDETILDTNYDLKKFLESKLWKIIR